MYTGRKELSYTQSQKQFSVVREVARLATTDFADEITVTFNEMIQDIFGKNTKTTFKRYRIGSKCRFTVIFKEWKYEPNLLCLILKQIVNAAVEAAYAEYRRQESCKHLREAVANYGIYEKGQKSELRELKKKLC